MTKKSSILLILGEFLTCYPRQFSFLFMLLVIEGAAAAISVLTLVPMAEFMLDPSLANPGRVTYEVILLLGLIGVQPTFWVFGGLFVLANLIKGCLEIGIRYAVLRIKYAVCSGLFGDALHAFFKARWEFFCGSDQGTLLNTLNRELNTIGDTLGCLATLVAQIVQLSIYLVIPIWLNAKLTLTALCLALIFGAPFLLLHRLSYRLGQRNTETANASIGILSEILGAARLILGFGRQDQSRQRFINSFNQHTAVTLNSQTLSTAIPKFFQPMAMLAVVISLGFAVKDHASISELVAVMWSLLGAMPILASLLQGNITVSNFLPSYEQLLSLRLKATELEEIQGSIEFKKLRDGIEFKNIFFNYPGRTKTLVGLNLHIKKGQMTALVGESGSGKSTVTDLVLGLQIPLRGEVLIDGIPLDEWRQNSFRERVGYVPQDPQLFHSSIRENLLWSFSAASESELWNALQLSNAANFVRELPQGIDTVVGERGVRLSGGQRQRIALARAILRKPELLILDEATSALDSESERLIQKSIENVASNTTILVVAHRLSTIAKSDYVYVLDQGSIAEQGSFGELSTQIGGILNKMLALQLPSDVKNLAD